MLFVVANGSDYLAWDDKGAMSTGYPMWVPLERAQFYPTKETAVRAGESVKRIDKVPVWVVPVSLNTGEAETIVLPEDHPDWAEYQRLKTLFEGA